MFGRSDYAAIPAFVLRIEPLFAVSTKGFNRGRQPSSTDEVERVALAVASEIDAIDDELANTSALAVPDKQEFRRAASERIARAAIAAMVTKP
jgi:hypothetical protein